MGNKIETGHGSGGLMTQKLIREMFYAYLGNDILKAAGDSAITSIHGQNIAITTDSYVVNPLFFPGGDLGKLAICGTVNDLAVSGAKPLYLTAGFILEEGLSVSVLEKVVKSMKDASEQAGVKVVAGDTKVVPAQKADGIYINTSGIGTVKNAHKEIASGSKIRQGDVIIVNGTIGDHEAAIINAREQFFEETKLTSDCASLQTIILDLLEQCHEVRFMRDITRGGLSGILHEIAGMTGKGIDIFEDRIPINDSVKAFCETLGFEPLHFANEGKFVLIIPGTEAEKALSVMKRHEKKSKAAIIGVVKDEHAGEVVMETSIGGKRLLEPLRAAKTPRIC